MTISYVESFDLSTQVSDLALSPALTVRLADALGGPHGNEIRSVIETTITRLIRHYGVDTDTGEWLGDWAASNIVSTILAVAAVPAAKIKSWINGRAFWDLKVMFPDLTPRMHGCCVRAAHAIAREIHGSSVNVANRRRLSPFPREIWEIFRDNGTDDGIEISTPANLNDTLWAVVYALPIEWAGDMKCFVCRDASADWYPIVGMADGRYVPRMSGIDYDTVEYRLSH